MPKKLKPKISKLKKEQQEEFYNEILKFYDFAEDLIDIIESPESEEQEIQANLAIPVIEQVQNSTDVIAESYLSNVKNNGISSGKDIKKVEIAMRKIFAVVVNFATEVKNLPENVGKATEVILDHYKSSIAYKLVQEPNLLWIGPNGKIKRDLMESHSHFQKLIRGVLNIGNHAELLSRAMLNPVIGLIKNIDLVEPGYRRTVKEVSMTSRFTQMVGFSKSPEDINSLGV